jgi:hypothetical protein
VAITEVMAMTVRILLVSLRILMEILDEKSENGSQTSRLSYLSSMATSILMILLTG